VALFFSGVGCEMLTTFFTANAHQNNMGLGTTTDWWNGNQISNNYGPAPLQHDWSQKNNLWNPASSNTNSFGVPQPIPPPTVVPSAGGHPIGHPLPPIKPVFFALFLKNPLVSVNSFFFCRPRSSKNIPALGLLY
jgi:hypothetical protein